MQKYLQFVILLAAMIHSAPVELGLIMQVNLVAVLGVLQPRKLLSKPSIIYALILFTSFLLMCSIFAVPVA